MVDEHDETREEESYQGVPDWSINRDLSITAIFPRRAGHTYLASYLASTRPTTLVYRDVPHLKELTDKFPLHPESETISMYEIFFALYKPDIQTPSQEMIEMNKRFQCPRLVVVDNYLRIPHQIRDYIFGLAQGPIVLLGH